MKHENHIFPEDKEVQAAWDRFLNDSYTQEDTSLIIGWLKDNNLQEFYAISEKEWKQSGEIDFCEAESVKETYRLQAIRLLAAHEKKQKEQSRMKQAHAPMLYRAKRFYRYIVVVLLLCLLVPAAYFYFNPINLTETVSHIEVATERGEVKSVTLPDGSIATLNANSSITYPVVFLSGERLIKLQGEALFQVVENQDQPFVVQTGQAKVKVLGTVFDVKAYTEDALLLVSVASGKVSVNLSDIPTLLEKNEQLKFNKTSGEIEKLIIDAEKYLSWTSGTLYFYRTPITEVVNMLNRHYLQDIELAEGQYSNLISGEHDNKNLESVLKSIGYSSGIKYKKENKKIILYQEN